MSDKYNVSMPYLGLSSFLQRFGLPYEKYIHMFQCPTTGFLLFYESNRRGNVKCTTVSMPYHGLSSFLRYVYASLEITGFANPFLRVII